MTIAMNEDKVNNITTDTHQLTIDPKRSTLNGLDRKIVELTTRVETKPELTAKDPKEIAQKEQNDNTTQETQQNITTKKLHDLLSNDKATEDKVDNAPQSKEESLDPKTIEERYKKQLNDTRSSYHKTNIANKLLKQRINKAYDEGDIDDTVKEQLLSSDDMDDPVEEQSLYEWDKLMSRATEDLKRRYEYTKDESLKRKTQGFDLYYSLLQQTEPKKAEEISELLQQIEKESGVSAMVTEMLAIGENECNGELQELIDNNLDVKTTVRSLKQKVLTAEQKAASLEKQLKFVQEELNKYNEVYQTAAKDYVFRNDSVRGFGQNKLTGLERAQQGVELQKV